MSIILEEWKRVLDFVTGPRIPIILSILSFLSTLPIFFFIWGNLFFLTIFFEIILWVAGIVLAFASGFAMTNLKKGIIYSFWAGIKTMVLLHMPRYVLMGLGLLIFDLRFIDYVGPELFFKNVILQMTMLGFGLLLIIAFIGGLLGGIGGVIGKGMGSMARLSTTRPTRKNWKIKN